MAWQLWRTQGELDERPPNRAKLTQWPMTEEAEGGGLDSLESRKTVEWVRNKVGEVRRDPGGHNLHCLHDSGNVAAAPPQTKTKTGSKKNLDKYLHAVASLKVFSNTLLRQNEKTPTPKQSCFASAKSRFSLSGGNSSPLLSFLLSSPLYDQHSVPSSPTP